MAKKLNNKQHAFTLLELLIVMVILALLAGMGLMAFGTIQMKSRDSRRKQDLSGVSKALELYHNDFGNYPASDSGLIMGCGAGGTSACNWGGPWTETTNNTIYMSMLPMDPAANQNYYYHQINNNSYYLFARLENEDDIDAAVTVTDNPGFYQGVYTCGGAVGTGCNYLIMSTNVITIPSVL